MCYPELKMWFEKKLTVKFSDRAEAEGNSPRRHEVHEGREFSPQRR
jgi:hypothetical protein